MAKVKINILFNDDNEVKKVLAYVDDECIEDNLVQLVTNLNNLTSGKLKDIYSAVQKFLNYDDGEITDAELLQILNGEFTPAQIDNPITNAEISAILRGDFQPMPGADIFTTDDFIF